MVFQSAMNALNPVMRVGDQFVDMMRAHEHVSKRDALAQAGQLLDLVGIDARRLRSYPHELSGGMRQRVIIAMALALRPELVILDEPTTALDVVVQREILQQVGRPAARVRLRGALHHARSLAPVRVRPPHRDHVRGRDRRADVGGRAAPRAAAPVHGGPDALVPAAPRAARADDRHPRLAARRRQPAGRLPLPHALSALRAGDAALYARQTTERPRLHEAEPAHFVACHLVEERR